MQVDSDLMPPHDEDTTKFTPIAQALYFQLIVRKIFLGFSRCACATDSFVK